LAILAFFANFLLKTEKEEKLREKNLNAKAWRLLQEHQKLHHKIRCKKKLDGHNNAQPKRKWKTHMHKTNNNIMF
jgi:hypothetical protein